MKIFIIIGTRPEAIKLSSVIHQLKKHPDAFTPCVCLTGQHRKLIDPAISFFGIKPDYDLDIMTDDQTLFDITTRILERLKPLLHLEKPDLVMVQGDTTSAFSGALAASFYQIPVCHVEAGLRTGRINAPFPEEINRRLITVLSGIHFAPTPSSKENLIKEGIPAAQIHVTGNTSIDALVHALNLQEGAHVQQSMYDYFTHTHGLVLSPQESSHKVILVTVHRRENAGEPLKRICNALIRIEKEHPDVRIVFCHHLNGRITATVGQMLNGHDRIHVIPPLDYPSFVYLLRNATLVLTDSGGIQEEATWLGKPFFILRDETERHEAVEIQIGKLIGTEEHALCDHVRQFLSTTFYLPHHENHPTCFGDGHAGKRIVQVLAAFQTA